MIHPQQMPLPIRNNQHDRHHYIDALRVIAIALMFVYHVSMIFVAEWDWHIKDDSRSNVLMEINHWMAFFRMPLLFFVSGFVSCALLDRLRSGPFILQRFKRLIIPTIVWTFILVAPQIYFERRLQGVEFTFLEFYGTFLEFEWWPEGNFHWLHLWFIPYLFLYNVLSIPLHRFLRSDSAVVKRIAARAGNSSSIFLFIFVAIIPYTFLSTRFPVTYDLIHDYARHSFFIFFVFAGVVAHNFQGILATIEAKRAIFARSAFASIIAINVIRWNGWEPRNLWSDWLDHPLSYVYIALLNLNAWLWALALLGYGKRYLNKGSKLLAYCNQAVYPFYILHQTVIVVIGFYVAQTPDEAALKYLFLLTTCFFVSISIYHLFIRPFRGVRFLFGAK